MRRLILLLATLATTFAYIPHSSCADIDDILNPSSTADPKYVITFPAEPHQHSSTQGVRTIPMTAHDGARYICTVPEINTNTAGGDFNTDTEEAFDDETYDDIDAVLAPLQHASSCFYHADGGWWTTEVCFMRRITQFHRDGTQRIDVTSLGSFNASASRAKAVAEADTDLKLDDFGVRYHAQLYDGGSSCEELGADFVNVTRQSELRVICSEDGTQGVMAVEERATCRYTLTFRTPTACASKRLRKPREAKVETIACSRVRDFDSARADSNGSGGHDRGTGDD